MKKVVFFSLFMFSLITAQENKCFKLSHPPSVYDTTIVLKANICEGELLYTKNSFKKKNQKLFSDSLIISKTSSFCFFQKINDSIVSLGCNTYLIDFTTNFHIVSLTINNNDFFGEKYGIYANGLNCKYD